MIRKVTFLLIFFSYCSLFAYQWPIAGGFLTASFGENNANSFLKGIRISGYGSVVSPFLKGEIIFYSDENSQLTSVMGNTRVLHHDNGFRSIYGHLENAYREPENFFVTENDQLGIVGNSGRSYEKSLFLMIYDTKLNQYVNPQIILPPSGDLTPPVISKVYILKNEEKIELHDKNSLVSGKVKIYAEIIDYGGSSQNNIETVPYSISMFYLGNEINLIKYDTLKEERGELILQGGRPVTFSHLYDGDNFYLGEINLSSGIAFLEISASDYYGNSNHRTFQFNKE
ncbi:MAG: peptidoglycan DD-metalloendopeptidase family protein [Spirochaetaceae bacterium]|nr:peptidoglycan DD-metalloendopeptidase family protein [Spirochaetaceae bacterium]